MALLGYVTLDEANVYIAAHYLEADPLRVQWEALNDADKSALLRKSFQVIELLPLTGRKTDCEQANMFPRWPDTEVPEAVKQAQIENALSYGDSESVEDQKYYDKLWKYGVSSYSIGNLSEKISSGSYGAGIGAQKTGVVSPIATRLLQPYVGGGYRI